jgi:hypothetical protein
VLQNFYSAAQNSCFGKLLVVEEKIELGLFNEALTLNSSIFASNIVEQNLQTANNMLLKKLTNYNYSYTGGDIVELNLIAAQCEMEGGKGVILARNILMQLSKGIIAFANNCNSNGRIGDDTEQRTGNTEDNFTLYPNPNDGNFTLNYTIALDAQLNITDVTGKVICTYNLLSNANSIEVNCKELSNGCYLYNILLGGSVIKSDKIIIIK